MLLEKWAGLGQHPFTVGLLSFMRRAENAGRWTRLGLGSTWIFRPAAVSLTRSGTVPWGLFVDENRFPSSFLTALSTTGWQITDELTIGQRKTMVSASRACHRVELSRREVEEIWAVKAFGNKTAELQSVNWATEERQKRLDEPAPRYCSFSLEVVGQGLHRGAKVRIAVEYRDRYLGISCRVVHERQRRLRRKASRVRTHQTAFR